MFITNLLPCIIKPVTFSASCIMDPSQERRRDGISKAYRGVRKRAWGKWVSEIRVPRSGKRIWLGSYDAPEKAARAYDAALYCIRGEQGTFNFPADKKPQLPGGSLVQPLSKKDIQTIATNFASSDVSVVSSSHACSLVTAQVSSTHVPVQPDLPVFTESSKTYEPPGEPYIPLNATTESITSIEDLQLDNFLMMDIEWISDLF